MQTNSGLKRLWRRSSSAVENAQRAEGDKPPVCSVLVLQVWPSQTSLRGDGDGQSVDSPNPDSGIASTQASPSPASGCVVPASSPSINASRKLSRSLLHPDHARLMTLRPAMGQQSTDADAPAPDDPSSVNNGFVTSCSSSAASSTTSVAHVHERRRSSTLTARYSLLDALDLEYALMRAAGRGSLGPCSSLSQSLQKLTFTQSLAFPALARGLADKRSKSERRSPRLDPLDSGVNAFAKVATALVLVLVSVLVFGVVYKFART